MICIVITSNSVRVTDDSVIGFVSTVAAPASSSVENRITLADNLRLAEDHEVVGFANVAHLIAGNDQIQETASKLEQLTLEDNEPVIVGSCHMMFGNARNTSEGLYGYLSLRRLLDTSLAPMPTEGNVHIWTVQNGYQRLTVTRGTYLAGIASNRCAIK